MEMIVLLYQTANYLFYSILYYPLSTIHYPIVSYPILSRTYELSTIISTVPTHQAQESRIVKRLGQNVVRTMTNEETDVTVESIPSNSEDVSRVSYITYCLGGCRSIHIGHHKVHKNDVILSPLFVDIFALA